VNLFDYNRQRLIRDEQPLAARLRPRNLDQYIGQEHILAPGRLLRRAIQADQLSSLLFYGPPGTGKTTLAMVIANTTRSAFATLNAVLAGVSDIRRITAEAQQRLGEQGQRTILFVDEVHRWNKAQQDALLPWVENGTLILIGATTENPYFTVNAALASRSRIFQLKPLTCADLRQVVAHALADCERGYGKLDVKLDPQALDHLVEVANGDARAVLNALQLAVETTAADAQGQIRISLAVAEESIQRRAVLYDREGDYHFDTISAFIKSLRGSDPDAALYWLAKMVYAGEDPRFLFRRMLIFAGEDIGLADPNAIVVAEAAAAAFERIGMPEGNYPLATTALYLATAPKSNSVMGFFDALRAIETEQEAEVPNHLRDASRDKKGFGHGLGYAYPHAYRDHWVAQQYLPTTLQGKMFYRPGQLGYEQRLSQDVQRRREAQLAAAIEAGPAMGAPPEILSFSPDDKAAEHWLARTLSGASERLGETRDQLFKLAAIPRHALVLDLYADSGVLCWEAVRQNPEGGTWAIVHNPIAAEALREQAMQLPELRRPIFLNGSAAELQTLLAQNANADIRFDHIIGRNALNRGDQQLPILQQCAAHLRRGGGTLTLAQVIPRHGQRLYALLPLNALDAETQNRLRAAEDAIYTDPDDPMVAWDEAHLCQAATAAGLRNIRTQRVQQSFQQRITPAMFMRWFMPAPSGQRQSYSDRLRPMLDNDQLAAVEALYRQHLYNQTATWQINLLYFHAIKS